MLFLSLGTAAPALTDASQDAHISTTESAAFGSVFGLTAKEAGKHFPPSGCPISTLPETACLPLSDLVLYSGFQPPTPSTGLRWAAMSSAVGLINSSAIVRLLWIIFRQHDCAC